MRLAENKWGDSMPKKVLFISHDALRTGAPLFLLNLLKWFGTNSELTFRILLKNGGDLESEFQALAKRFVRVRRI